MRRIEKDADGRFHFSEREYYATRELFGIVSTFNKCSGELERRVREIPGGWRDFRLIQTLSEKLLIGILRTVPQKKLAAIKRELDNTEVLVNVRRDVSPPSREETDGFTYVSQRALERITQRVVDFECLFCQKKGVDAKRCLLRRDIEATYNFEYDCPAKQGCPFQGATFGGEYGENEDEVLQTEQV